MAASGKRTPPSSRKRTAYPAQLVPVVEMESTQLPKLKTPPGTDREHAALKRYRAAVNEVAGDYRRLDAALRASPVATLALANGLRSCGNPSGTVA